MYDIVIPRAHRPTSARACVHTRKITKIHQYMSKPKHPCTLRVSLRLSMPNTVQVQRASLSTRAIARSVHHPGWPCQMRYTTCIPQDIHAKCCTGTGTVREFKHADHRAIGVSPKLAMPNAIHYVRRPGYPCQILYGYKYNVRVQACGPSRHRCIIPDAHAKCGRGTNTACESTHAGTIGASPSPCHKSCTCTSAACELKHAGLSTIGASPRLLTPKHSASSTNTVRTCKHKHSCILRTPPRLPMPYTVQCTHTRTHDE